MTGHVRGGETEFHFFRGDARQAFLVGDFNDWNQSALPMTRTNNGEWVCRLKLPNGTYQFKYWADGEWFVDYAAFGVEPCEFGCNSVLLVDGDRHESFSDSVLNTSTSKEHHTAKGGGRW